MSKLRRSLLQAAAGAGGVDTGDDDFANVALLLDGDGTSDDNNETFTDSSTNGFTVTENGSVVQGSFSPYGNNWSNYFDGSEYIITTTAPPAIGTNDFTIEFWYCGNAQSNRYPNIVGTMDAFSATGVWRVMTYNNNSNTFMFAFETTPYTFNTENYNDGVWRHFAVTREGTSLKGFVNGVQQGSTLTFSSSLSSRKILVAGNLRDNDHQEGFISNVRVINGTALYTSNFTPPTGPLSAVTNTDFLACQSNRFLDNSSNSFAFTLSGTPKVSPFSPFKDDDARDITTDGGSAYFDGTLGNYLDIADDAALTPSGDFTIEFWAYVTDSSNVQEWYSKGYGIQIYISGANWGVALSASNNSSYYFNYASTSVVQNAWTHVAVTRSGNTYRFFINGSQVTSTSSASAPNTGTGVVRIGDWSGGTGYEAIGYISDVRYVNGSASYTSAFTPPTSPVTAITNTDLLLNFQDSGIYDRSGINNLDTVGDARLGLAPIYGTGFIDFDGGVDYLKFNNAVPFGTGDFTIELWVNFTEHANYRFLYDCRVSTQSSDGFALGVTSTGSLYVYSNGFVLNTGSVPLKEWAHIALVRESGTIKTYINGSLVTSASYTNNCTSTVHWIGDGSEQIYDTNYSADDIRITKGIARYTSNFTPPTEIDLSTDTYAEYVTLFLDGDGTANGQNNTFTDSSTNGFTVTESGSVVQGVFSPYGDNWSNYFDVDLLSTSFTAIGSSDFTLEFWAMVEEDTTGRWFAGTGTGTGSFQIGAGSGGKWSFYTESNVLRFNGTTSIAKSTWYHVAVSRSGSTIKLFINGSEEASATDSVNYSATSLGIGGYSSTNASCYGYISNFRIVVGTALYTSAFTPPTTPLTAVTNTKLLTCQSNRFVDNSSDGNSILIQTGTPKVSRFSPFESDKPYDITTDGGSGNFDGSSAYLSAPSDAAFAFGTGDYTIEAWVYPTTIRNGENLVYVTEVTGGTSFGYNQTQIYIGARGITYDLQVSYALKTNEWTHIAACRDNGTVRIFANGALVGSGSVTRSCPQGAGAIGQYPPLTNYGMTGYIADPRVIKGTALYTSAFTPPTAPLTSVTNTSLLLNFQDSAIPDLSGINNIDTVGNAKVGASDPTKYGSNAMQFDGTSDYFITPNKSELILAGGSWTVECWVYPTADYSTYRTIFTKRVSGTGTTSYQGYLRTSTGVVSFYNGTNYESSTALTSNQWSHCAWVYDGTNINIYVNGTSVLSSAVTITEVDQPLVIGGARGYSEWFGGYIDDLRITKGVARYTTSFTPPTEALPKF